MPAENVHHRKGKKKYTVVLIPGDEAEKTKSFSVDKFGAGVLVFVLFIAIIAIGVVAIVYTPVGNLVPIPAPKLEQTYGRQIAKIQEQVKDMMQEMIALQSYNLRLRKALGERISSTDTTTALERASQSPTAGSSTLETEGNLRSDRLDSSVALPLDARASLERGLVAVGVDQPLNRVEREFLPLTMPADGYLTRGFDALQDHFGIDIAGKRGSGVFAAADGTVVFAGWTYDDGFVMMISHSQGYMTVYKHNDTLLKTAGESVKRGDLIALLGNTGKTSSGPHLHFEVWKDGTVYDPDNYLLIPQ